MFQKACVYNSRAWKECMKSKYRLPIITLLLVGVTIGVYSLLSPASDPVLVGAGDIADCNTKGAAETAQLIEKINGTVFAVGDEAYENGTAEEFKNCYDSTWGAFKDRTRPATGNHEYLTPDADPYYTYFGDSAGVPGEGYYSYNLGAWHIIVLNSNISAKAGSKQEKWLRADLAADQAVCTLAYWHHPRFSSGYHGITDPPPMEDAWRDLYEFKADVVINGHDHDYERFAPQDPNGQADPTRGIREFVVGTGGAPHRTVYVPQANSEVFDTKTWGVLKLTLHPTSYDWEFIPVVGETFHDSGSAECVS
jgi:calcineurin-like phosphoesterase family protein